ncbi:SpaH/EbpB family LPXTG-anchored major pilin [Actinomyces trachealis]|uniref:SpaH/EbpB family LPXTG-anchored major pilin n=1 Tax=Actinomyces trachealis TaxID=2763540 RepID=UPI0018C48C60|nr:SpaH/EbpB family LPXTG-anchored major pilin [Actinomyces trachealis]
MSSLMIRRSVGLAAAVTLAAGALVVPATAATPAANVDGNHASTLTVHKCEQTDTNGVTVGTGNDDPGVECKAVKGVEFTITELSYDLTTQQGWIDLAAAKGDVNKAADAAHKTGTTFKHITEDSGVITFTDAETTAGKAYLVSETKTPAGVIPAADFIVTLPMTNPGNTSSWNYDVHVYPKNTVAGVKKEVSDSGRPSGSGNALTYTITTSIPKVGDEGIKKYQVIDILDPRVQTGLGADQLNPIVTLEGPRGTVDQLVANDDYTVTVAKSANPADKHNYLTVDFTAAGLKKLAAARQAGTGETKVKTVLTATFAEATDLDGGVSNIASLIPSDSPNYNWDKDNPNPGGDPNNPTVPGTNTDPVTSKYGQIEITKTGTDSLAAAKYNGAQFEVYECSIGTDDAALAESNVASKNDGVPVLLKDVDATLKGDKLTVANETTFETGKQTKLQAKANKPAVDGKVVIGSLRANDWENGKAKDLNKDNWYCLVETKAPAGYSLAPDPIPFRILAKDTEDKATDTAVTVVDVPANAGFHLPLTGANGVVLLTTIGSLLVLGGGAVAFYNHRRRREERD